MPLHYELVNWEDNNIKAESQRVLHRRMELSGAPEHRENIGLMVVIIGLMVDRIQIRWHKLTEGRVDTQECLDNPCSG